jgi:hypothetical protein
MPIIGFTLKKITAEKANQLTGKIKVTNNLKILDIQPEETTFTKSEEVLRFDFKFSITYEPEIGIIEIEGSILYMDDPKKTKQIIETWKKDNQIKKEVRLQIYNAILARCNVKALNLAQDVGLPPHFRLPTVRIKNN